MFSNAILIYNTESGQSKKGRLLEPIKAHFEDQGIPLKIVKIPLKGEDIVETLEKTSLDGADLCIAAGGDGTVSLIGSKLINTNVPLGILPLGTGNLLAQELNIPINLEKALVLITADQPSVVSIDAIQMGERCSINNVSVGVIPKVMKETPAAEKQRLGLFAYLIHFINQFLGLRLNRFFLEYDHQHLSFLASEVLITNGQSVGVHQLKWSEKIAINDGYLDLFIIRAKCVRDFFALLYSIIAKRKRDDIVKYIRFSDYCRIETPNPIPVQADGDTFGETPLEIKVLSRVLSVIVGENLDDNLISKGVNYEKI